MTAIVILKQRDAVHFVTDGASYNAAGVVNGLGPKVGLMPHLNAAVFTRGPANVAQLAALHMGSRFASFDELIVGVEEFMPHFYLDNEPHMRASGFPDLDVYLLGWSVERDRPEAFNMKCAYEDSECAWQRSGDAAYRSEPFRLVEAPAFGGAPSLTAEELRSAKFPMHLGPDDLAPELACLHVMEIQRRTPKPMLPDLPPIHTVGGFALLTSIGKSHLSQRVLARYNDLVGETIAPAPIDWDAWIAEQGGYTACMSKLKRDMAEKRSRKLGLRVVR